MNTSPEPEDAPVQDLGESAQHARTMARAIEDGVPGHDAPVVLLEDGDGQLEVAPGSAALPSWMSGSARGLLEDVVAAGDRAALAEARQAARVAGQQRACRVLLGADELRDRWYEVRFLPGLLPDRLVILLADVTRQRRLAAEASLLRRVTELANAGSDIDEVARQAVVDVRATMGWDAGHVVVIDDGTLLEGGGWDPAGATADLAEVLAEHAAPATAAAAAAAERAAPVTSQEVADGELQASLVEAGVATVALPIVTDGEVVRVLELFTAAPLALDDDQRSLLAEIGRQLGSVMIRHRYLEQLEASHRELERSNAELERFAYVASHDLQEPLRKIVGFTELMQDRYEPRDGDERDFQDYIVRSAHRLQRLITDLLAFSRAGRRELAADPVELDDVLTEVLADLSLAIEEAGASVEVAPLPAVVGDAGQLREVMQNVIANALKYRDDDRSLRITVTGEVDGPNARIVAADNGIGIDPEHREQVFEVFRRLHPGHAYGGTGLGLALVKRIVERHGGSVRVADSPLGEGIAVDLTLPRHQEQP